MTSGGGPLVRDATVADLAALTAIYGHNVLTGTGTFETIPPDESEMGRRFAAIAALDLPWLVADIDDGVVGYAYAGPFRTRPAYRFTVETSVYVGAGATGRGVGRALLIELIARCDALGLRQMLAVIGDSENAASIGLHAAQGFELIGTMPAVGWKFERWLDVVFMQRQLGPGETQAPDAVGIPLG
ncbi:GNAT family N-acetyltransferase [soil metagenome]